MKKLSKALLSFVLIIICSFSLVGCFFDFDEDNEESIYGTYYFNDIINVDEENEDNEQLYYGMLLGSTIVFEEDKITMSMGDGSKEYTIVFDVVEEDVGYKMTADNPFEDNEQMVYYGEFSNGVANITIDGATAQFLKDQSKVVKKYDYINKNYKIELKNEDQGGQQGNLAPVGLPWVHYSFINIKNNKLILFVNCREFKYNMTKNGNVFDLNLTTANVNNLLHDGTLKVLENGLEIVYEDSETKTTITYVSVDYHLNGGNENTNDNSSGSGNNGGDVNIQESIYGTYYFSDIAELGEDNEEYEQVFYGMMLGSTITFEENKFTMAMSDGSEEYTIVFDVVKESNRYKMTADDPFEDNKQIIYYGEFSNGVANIEMEGVTAQFLKDQSKVVKKYDYKCVNYTLGSGDEDQGLQQSEQSTGSSISGVGQIALAWMPQYSFINIKNNTLSLFAMGKEIQYSMTKNGSVYNLTLITANVDNLFHNGTVDVLADGLEIVCEDAYFNATFIYIKM